MRKNILMLIPLIAFCLQTIPAFGSTPPPSPEDMADAMRKVGVILAQPPLVPVPAAPPSLITADANIMPVRFANKAGVVLINTQKKEIEVIDLETMERISRYQSSVAPSMMGTMTPNGRLFTTTDDEQLNIRDTRTGAVIAGIPLVWHWMFHWLDERTAFYVNKQSQSFFIDFVSGQSVPTGLMSMPLSYAARVPDKRGQYVLLATNKVFKFELMRNKPMPELKLLSEKPVESLSLASNTSGTTSDGNYFFDVRSHLTLINLRTLESETISLEPFYFQTSMAAPDPDTLIVTGFIQPHDGSVPQDYLYSISHRSLAQITPDKQSSSLRRIYIKPLRKLGIINGNQIALMGPPQTAENIPLGDFTRNVVSKSEQNKIVIADRQQALVNSCLPSKEKNKDGIELHAVGVYEGPLGRDKSEKNKVDIAVYESDQPVALALFSYEPVTWNITLDKDATLREVILNSSDGIKLTGTRSKAVKVTRQNFGYTAYEDCNFFRMVAPKLKEFSGLNATSFQGAYRGIGFPIRPQNQAITAAASVRPVTTPTTKSVPELDEGLAAYERGDYRAALKMLMPLADKNVAMAQNTIGKMYLGGQGVPKDYTKAMQLFRNAARQRLPNAQNNVGVMYASGYGVPQDFRQAIVWFEKAANQGFVNAMLNLVDIYESGIGISRDPIAAEKWRTRAQGLAPSKEMGTVTVGLTGSEEYSKGLDLYYGFRFREAFCQLLHAAEKGHPEAQLKLESMYRNGQGGEKDERQAQYWTARGDARNKALEQARKAGMKIGDLAGSKEFTEGLRLSQGGKKREAFCFFLKAAEQDHPEAQLKLATMYQRGEGGKKDESKARYWAKKAATKGYTDQDGRDRIYVIDSSSPEGRQMPTPPSAPAPRLYFEN